MDNEETPIANDQPEEDVFASKVEAMETLEIVEPAPPSRFQRLLRKLLLWAVGLLGVFALGVALTWVVQVRPKAERIQDLEETVGTLEADMASLNSELEELRPVVKENEDLQSSLAKSDQRLDLMRVLVDVTTAQLALTQENSVAAKAALAGTADRLTGLEARFTGSEAEIIDGLKDRLALVLEEMDDNAFAARRDLEVLANNLLSLERSLFAE